MNVDILLKRIYVLAELIRTGGDSEITVQVISTIEKDLKQLKKDIQKGEK